MRKIAAAMLCAATFTASSQHYTHSRPANNHYVITSVKVFIDEHGIPYDAVIVQRSYTSADQKALNQAMSQAYEPIRGSQGERLEGWRIVDFRNRP